MPSDPRDYRLDIPGLNRSGAGKQSQGRPFLSIHFACCGVYCRIYRNSEGTAYVGRCPRCGKPVKFDVGEGGTDARFFVVE
jgi:hypothetical protein